jgi:hypothetical protein
MYTKTKEEEIKNLGLEKTHIYITFNPEKSSFEENYASCNPRIVNGIQEGFNLNFDLKMINEHKLDDYDLQGLISHEGYHMISNEMRYIFSGEKHRKNAIMKNLHPSDSIYQDGLFAYYKLNDLEEILMEYLTFQYGINRKDGGFIWNIKHEGFKNIFDYLDHELEELTKDIKNQIKKWRYDFEPYLD